MSDFRRLSERVSASPQIDASDVAEAKSRGFVTIVNNRPDGEAPDQPSGAEIEAAAKELGLSYHAIPITHAGFGEAEVAEMERVLGEACGPVLAYCRSGTRSTLLWSLVQARGGMHVDAIEAAAGAAGYDVSPIRSALERLAANARD